MDPRLAELLRARKVEHEELVFPDEIHGFLRAASWQAQIGRCICAPVSGTSIARMPSLMRPATVGTPAR